VILLTVRFEYVLFRFCTLADNTLNVVVASVDHI
jgi:hypothetical protein